MLARWSFRQKRELVVKTKNCTWATGSLYRLGKDDVLRRCVPSMERMALLEEAHKDGARGHMAIEVMAKKLL